MESLLVFESESARDAFFDNYDLQDFSNDEDAIFAKSEDGPFIFLRNINPYRLRDLATRMGMVCQVRELDSSEARNARRGNVLRQLRRTGGIVVQELPVPGPLVSFQASLDGKDWEEASPIRPVEEQLLTDEDMEPEEIVIEPPLSVATKDWPVSKLRKNRAWLVFETFTWDYLMELCTWKQIPEISPDTIRCLERLHNEGWLASMQLHYFGKSQRFYLNLEEELSLVEGDAQPETAVLRIDLDTTSPLHASTTVGVVRSKEERAKPLRIRGNLQAERVTDKNRPKTSMVSTTEPDVLVYYLRRTPFSLFQDAS